MNIKIIFFICISLRFIGAADHQEPFLQHKINEKDVRSLGISDFSDLYKKEYKSSFSECIVYKNGFMPMQNKYYATKKEKINEKDVEVKVENYLFFPSDTFEGVSFYLDKTNNDSYRLDIQGNAKDGDYVNIQLQIGSGTEKCYASMNIKKGIPYHICHLHFVLAASMYMANGRFFIQKHSKQNPAKLPDVPTLDVDDSLFSWNKMKNRQHNNKKQDKEKKQEWSNKEKKENKKKKH
jgi:hypothetical protein